MQYYYSVESVGFGSGFCVGVVSGKFNWIFIITDFLGFSRETLISVGALNICVSGIYSLKK